MTAVIPLGRPSAPPRPRPHHRPPAWGYRPPCRPAPRPRWRRWLLVPFIAVPLTLSGLVAAPPVAATSRSPAATAIDFALRQLGKPYQWGGAGPDRFDCSGLVMRAYQRAGVFLPRVSRNQYKAGRHIPIDDLRAGDLVFYAGNPRDPRTIGHVGMYLGGGRMVEAPRRGKPVRIASIWRKSLVPRAVRPYEGRRMLPVRDGERGSAVLAVQQRLAANGDCLAVDGEFGPVTLRTVRRFQARHGLVVDGIVGHRTWAALVSHGRMRSQPTC